MRLNKRAAAKRMPGILIASCLLSGSILLERALSESRQFRQKWEPFDKGSEIKVSTAISKPKSVPAKYAEQANDVFQKYWFNPSKELMNKTVALMYRFGVYPEQYGKIPDAAKSIPLWLGPLVHLAKSENDERAILSVIDLIHRYEVVEVASTAESVLAQIAEKTKDGKMVFELAGWLSSEEVYKCVAYFIRHPEKDMFVLQPYETASNVLSSLVWVAYRTWSKEKLLAAAAFILTCKPNAAPRVARIFSSVTNGEDVKKNRENLEKVLLMLSIIARRETEDAWNFMKELEDDPWFWKKITIEDISNGAKPAEKPGD